MFPGVSITVEGHVVGILQAPGEIGLLGQYTSFLAHLLVETVGMTNVLGGLAGQ